MHCYMRVSKVTIKVADSIALFLNRVGYVVQMINLSGGINVQQE